MFKEIYKIMEIIYAIFILFFICVIIGFPFYLIIFGFYLAGTDPDTFWTGSCLVIIGLIILRLVKPISILMGKDYKIF